MISEFLQYLNHCLYGSSFTDFVLHEVLYKSASKSMVISFLRSGGTLSDERFAREGHCFLQTTTNACTSSSFDSAIFAASTEALLKK